MQPLIDEFVPRPDFASRYEMVIPAPPIVVWQAWQEMDMSDPGPAAAWLFRIRDALARLRHGHAQRDMANLFIPLAEVEPLETVQGAVGRWWGLGAHKNVVDVAGVDGFRGFAEPGYAKGVVSMRFVPTADGGTRAITETRVLCTDAAARRAMGRYWLLIRPFSGLLRVIVLRTIRNRATR